MRAIKIEGDGTVGIYEGPEDFWMNEDVDWAEGPYPSDDSHVVYYDDSALFADEQVRTTLASVDYSLPMWVVGVAGERTVDATLGIEKIIADLGARRYPLRD